MQRHLLILAILLVAGPGYAGPTDNYPLFGAPATIIDYLIVNDTSTTAGTTKLMFSGNAWQTLLGDGNWGGRGLEQITEGGNTGWRLIGYDPANFEDIGSYAVNLSFSDNLFPGDGATGAWSFTEGINTEASGDYSHAEGQGTKAINAQSHAAGIYNVGTSPDTIHETGIGTYITPKNGFEIYMDGTLTAPSATDALIETRGAQALITLGYDQNARATLAGLGVGAADYGIFAGTTIPDDTSTKNALAALETAVELRGTNTTEMNIYTADDCSAVSGMVVGDLCFEY